jgi:hypothetical protein
MADTILPRASGAGKPPTYLNCAKALALYFIDLALIGAIVALCLAVRQ